MYIQDYASLFAHYEASHIICTEEACVQQRHVVFPSDIEWKKHMASKHMDHAPRRDIQAVCGHE
jgi:hypothetical protein